MRRTAAALALLVALAGCASTPDWLVLPDDQNDRATLLAMCEADGCIAIPKSSWNALMLELIRIGVLKPPR